MRRTLVVLALGGCLLGGVSGCATHYHQIGVGEQLGDVVDSQRQWYWLWGLIRLNNVDGGRMARGEKDYTIKSEITPTDVIINFFTGLVGFNSRTVAVVK